MVGTRQSGKEEKVIASGESRLYPVEVLPPYTPSERIGGGIFVSARPRSNPIR